MEMVPTIKDQSSFESLKLVDPEVTILDFNKDGYTDMFINGWDDNEMHRFSSILINDGFGKLIEMAQPNLIRKGFGSATWGDVDGDGWLDLLLNGDGGTDNEGSSDTYRLYRNNNGSLEAKATFNDYRQISAGDGARMIDWNNDGKLDIILTGWSNSKGRQATMLFTCSDAANFTYVENALSNTDFPGVSESSIETADLNNDGKIDLLITGYNGNQTEQVGKYDRNICGYYLNTTATVNAKPSVVPTLGEVITKSGEETMVAFSWGAATDDKTSQNALTYNLALKNTTTGKWLYNPMAVMGGVTDGWRKVSTLGNVFTNKNWELYNLPAGNYEWSVQAIDANFVGGTFAAVKTFSIATSALNEIIAGVNISATNGKLLISNKSGNLMGVAVYCVTGSLVNQIQSTNFVSLPLEKGVYIVKAVIGTKTMVQKIVL